MSLETGAKEPSLAGVVNRIGALRSGREVTADILSDAGKLIEILDPQIQFTDHIVVSGFVQSQDTNSRSDSGEPENRKQGFSFGTKNIFRVWPYIITKVAQNDLAVLNLYYEDPGDPQGLAVENRRMVHVLYKTADQDLTGIIRSKPVVRTLPGVRVITYSQQRLWGRGKVEIAGLTVQWGLFK